MSRPVAWNGSQWVDPAFWTGSEWKSYIPPAYDVPAAQFEFGANNESWTLVPGLDDDVPAPWTGGTIYGDTPEGIFSFLGLYSPLADVTDLPVGEQFGIRARALFTPVASEGKPLDCTLNVGTGAHAFTLPEGVWTAVETGPIITPRYDGAITGQKNLLGGQSSDSGYHGGKFRLSLDYWRLWNYTRNEAAASLGDPGWQPCVYDGRDWI